MADILLPLIEKYVSLTRAARTGGGEFAGPCPWCGGEDRFRVWPNPDPYNTYPHYWCRNCGRRGDAIKFLREKEGLSFRAAQEVVKEGRDLLEAAEEDKRRDRHETGPRTTPATVDGAPCQEWQVAALVFCKYAMAALWSDAGAKALSWLTTTRGIPEDVIKAELLGYNPEERWGDPEDWGLPPGKKVWLPRGIVIPHRGEDQWWKVEIRRAVGTKEKNKYVSISGGANPLTGYDRLEYDGKAIVVEGRLNQAILQREVGDLATVVATSSRTGAREDRWIAHLALCSQVLIGYDPDNDGQQSAEWWLERLRNARRWVPEPRGDINDLFIQGGLDFRAEAERGFALFPAFDAAAKANALARWGILAGNPEEEAGHNNADIHQCYTCGAASVARDLYRRGWCAEHVPHGAIYEDNTMVGTPGEGEIEVHCYLCGDEAEHYDIHGRAWCTKHAPKDNPEPVPTRCSFYPQGCNGIALWQTPEGYFWCFEHESIGIFLQVGLEQGWPELHRVYKEGNVLFGGCHEGREEYLKAVDAFTPRNYAEHKAAVEAAYEERNRAAEPPTKEIPLPSPARQKSSVAPPSRPVKREEAKTETMCSTEGCYGDAESYDCLGGQWCSNCENRAAFINVCAKAGFPAINYVTTYWLRAGEEHCEGFARTASGLCIRQVLYYLAHGEQMIGYGAQAYWNQKKEAPVA